MAAEFGEDQTFHTRFPKLVTKIVSWTESFSSVDFSDAHTW